MSVTDNWPHCFEQVIALDRTLRAPVVQLTDIRERRFQRRLCEIFCRAGAGVGGAGPHYAALGRH